MLLRESQNLDTADKLSVAMNHRRAILQRGPSEYQAWLLDLDGTLYRQPLVRAAMAGELLLHGWSAIRILRGFRYEHEQLRGAAETQEEDPFILQIARTALKLEITREEVARVVEDWMISRPGRWLKRFARRDLLLAVAQFRAAGGKTAIVSDYPARAKLKAMGIAELFDEVIACGELNGPSTLKPTPAGLVLAADRLGVTPNNCLVIGDRWDADGEAAHRAGMDFRHISMPLA